MKFNVIARIEFELAYYDVTIKGISHYALILSCNIKFSVILNG